MNCEDIIGMARKHGKAVQEQNREVEYRFTFEGVVALLSAEREACAKVCDELHPGLSTKRAAEIIRARGTE